MKICPKCQKTYDDGALNFCLDDGTVLEQRADQGGLGDSLPETVMMSSPRPTSPNEPIAGPTGQASQPVWGQPSQSSQAPQPNWGSGAGPQQAARPKSKTWMWVLGILAGVVVICGGGLIGLVAMMASMDGTNSSKDNTSIPLANKNTPEPNAGQFEDVDMSNWDVTNPAFAKAEFKNGEFLMGTVKKGFYYVLVSGKFKTEDKTTRLTVRNSDEEASRLGYGLIFHSDPTPLKQDYGLLIDADKKRYRVVKHSPGKETNIVKWTNSSVIKGGSQKNVLEVRDKDGKIDLYINGQFIESIKNEDGYSGGSPGIYSGDGVQTAFSSLEVSK